jgi:hypothetical protein
MATKDLSPPERLVLQAGTILNVRVTGIKDNGELVVDLDKSSDTRKDTVEERRAKVVSPVTTKTAHRLSSFVGASALPNAGDDETSALGMNAGELERAWKEQRWDPTRSSSGTGTGRSTGMNAGTGVVGDRSSRISRSVSNSNSNSNSGGGRYEARSGMVPAGGRGRGGHAQRGYGQGSGTSLTSPILPISPISPISPTGISLGSPGSSASTSSASSSFRPQRVIPSGAAFSSAYSVAGSAKKAITFNPTGPLLATLNTGDELKGEVTMSTPYAAFINAGMFHPRRLLKLLDCMFTSHRAFTLLHFWLYYHFSILSFTF